MGLPPWLPRSAAWANGVALYVFALGVKVAFGLALPFLIVLMRHWPRLGWIGFLLLWLSPVAAAAALHGVVDRLLGATARPSREAWLGGATSWWAGFVAWATMIFVTITMGLAAVVLDPPPMPDSLWSVVAAVMHDGSPRTAHALIWILLAAYVYEVEMRARQGAQSAA